MSEAISVWLNAPFDDVVIEPDLDDVPAFAAEREARWERISSADFLSDVEKRLLLGLPARPVQSDLRSIEGAA